MGGCSTEDSKSAYQRGFGSAPDLSAARRENFKPPSQVHVRADAAFMVSMSEFKRDYRVHAAEGARSSRAERVPPPSDTPNLICARAHQAPFGEGSSSYKEEFAPARYAMCDSSSAPALPQRAPDPCGRRTLAQVAAVGLVGRPRYN